MSINNYGELKTAVANWITRTDLTDRIPEFIALAESHIANDVRCKAMETRSTASISTEYFDIPDDFLEIRDIQINSDPIQALTYLSPKALSEKHPSSTTGKPKYYTIHGDEFQVKPIPSTSYTIEISYLGRFTAFSGDTDTNWLLTNHPGVYLYGACLEAAPLMEDDEAMSRYGRLFQMAVDKLNDSERRGKYGGVLTPVVNTPTP